MTTQAITVAVNCLFCDAHSLEAIEHTNSRLYFYCEGCGLLFADPHTHLSQHEERERYLQHNNEPTDLGYREFLCRLQKPLLKHISAEGKALDFGCGPEKAMASLFEESGYEIKSYDPLFFNKRDLLKERYYDLVACSEVVEHFNHPRRSWSLLSSLIRPGGVLGVMTSTLNEGPQWKDDFRKWYYANDPTHVCFYSNQFFESLSKRFSMRLIEVPHKNVRIFSHEPR